MKQTRRKLLRSRKGVSLTEVIVAMAVIAIVSVAATSTVLTSIRSDEAFYNKYEALSGCENAAECLRYAGGDDALLADALAKAGFDQTTVDGVEVVYTLTRGDETVTVTKDAQKENYVVTYNDEIIYTYVSLSV